MHVAFRQAPGSTSVSSAAQQHGGAAVVELEIEPATEGIRYPWAYLRIFCTVFPEPFAFNPDRWLGDVSPLMRRNFTI